MAAKQDSLPTAPPASAGPDLSTGPDPSGPPPPAFLAATGAHLAGVAADAGLRSAVAMMLDPGAGAADWLGPLRAGAGPALRIVAGRPELPATLALCPVPLATAADIDRAAAAFAAIRSTAECRLALIAAPDLLAALLRRAPFLNSVDSLCDGLAAGIGRACLAETVQSLPGTGGTLLVLRVLQ